MNLWLRGYRHLIANQDTSVRVGLGSLIKIIPAWLRGRKRHICNMKSHTVGSSPTAGSK